MIAFSSTDLAIRNAAHAGTLVITAHEGRVGPYWAISDEHGLIEVHLTEAEAHDRAAGNQPKAVEPLVI